MRLVSHRTQPLASFFAVDLLAHLHVRVRMDGVCVVNFRGDGPLRGVLALANGRLESRGYVGNPAVTLPPNALGKFDVGAGVGAGSLQVVRTKNLPGEEVSTPYTSITEIKTGEIPEDINWYLADSEQKEGALAAGVFVQGTDDGLDRNGQAVRDAALAAAPPSHPSPPHPLMCGWKGCRDRALITPSCADAVRTRRRASAAACHRLSHALTGGRSQSPLPVPARPSSVVLCRADAACLCVPLRPLAQLGGAAVPAAGGWYVQLLPFADDAAVEQLQKNLAALSSRSPTQMIRDGLRGEEMVNLLLEGLGPQIMSRKRTPPLSQTCPCSEARVFRTLRLLPRSEVDDIVEKNEQIEVKCEFCGKLYKLTPDEIVKGLEEGQGVDVA